MLLFNVGNKNNYQHFVLFGLIFMTLGVINLGILFYQKGKRKRKR